MVWWDQEHGHAEAYQSHAEAYQAHAEDYSVPFQFLVADYSTERYIIHAYIHNRIYKFYSVNS